MYESCGEGEQEKDEKAKLGEHKSSLSPEELRTVMERTRELKERQARFCP